MSEGAILAQQWNNEILRTELPRQGTEAYASVLRAKGQAAQTTMMVLARVNETEMKRQALGRLPELLKIIQDEETRMRAIEHIVD